MRIEPPPSFAWATATMPLATAAAEPPLEPPVVRVVSHGLRVGPYASGSVVGTRPSSGVFVRPTHTKPASRYRRASTSVWSARQPASFRNRMPSWRGSPSTPQKRSLNRIGTPRNGPAGSGPRAASRAESNSGWMTAFSCGSSFSIAVMAASTSSEGVASPRRTSSACAVASSVARSVTDAPQAWTGGRRSAQGRARSSCAATRTRTSSQYGAATSCTPIGNAFSFQYSGTDIAGCPVTLNGAA